MILAFLRRRSIAVAASLALSCGRAWAAPPTVVINSAGSNTAASGAGPSTALFGTAASTAASTTVTLLTDNPNLSGVATDGSAVLWVGSSSGRQFSKITGVNNTAGVKTVTVAVAYANTESGKNWGIGGKRATMAGSTALFNADWDVGWIVDVQTGETISSQIRFNPPALNTATSAPLITSTTYTTWGTQPLLQTATNSLAMFDLAGNGFRWENLQFKSTAATPATCFQAKSGGGGNMTFRNLIVDGFLMGWDGSNQAFWSFSSCVIDHCEVKNCTATGASSAYAIQISAGGLELTNCYLHDNKAVLYSAFPASLVGNVFANNTSGTSLAPIAVDGQQNVIRNNSIYNCGTGSNTGAALIMGTGGHNSMANVHEFNIYYGCVGYAVSQTTYPGFVSQYNAYGGNNGGGTGLNLGSGFPAANDITLTANPYVSTSTPNWGLNATAGGGVPCKGAAVGPPGASANTGGDLGAIPSGGGGASSSGAGKKAGPGGGRVGAAWPDLRIERRPLGRRAG